MSQIILVTIALFIGWSLSEILKKRKNTNNTPNIENDDRVKSNLRTFLLGVLFYSNFILLISLFILKYFFDLLHVDTDYILIYLVVTFLILFIGSKFVVKK